MKIFVPGRICLFGEHSDWAGGYRRVNSEIEKGYTITFGTEQGIYAEVEPHPDSLVLSTSISLNDENNNCIIPMEQNALLKVAQEGGFWSYIAGVAYQVLIKFNVGGLILHNDKTDLPVRKGLSSSAAICVLTARAFNHIYDLKLSIREEMELAYQGEITTPSRCGRMDQICAFGSRPMLMTYDGDQRETTELKVNKNLHFVIVDMHAGKNTVEILNRLNHCYPFAQNETARNVQKLFGAINKETVFGAAEAIKDTDAKKLGKLMTESHLNFDCYASPACPEELKAPVLHRLLNYPPIQTHIWGGKGVGSQGDGAAQFLARSAEDQAKIIEIIEKDLDMSCLKLTVHPFPKVRKAVIPAAGFGTRLFPASKAIKKEFFPIIDRDGISKPTILLIVEEALEAGIEEIIIVVQENDLEDFISFFKKQISIENYNKLPMNLQEYSQKILEMGRRIQFVKQSAQEGFGHAVYCAYKTVGDEPFLLMLGDHLYRSEGEKSFTGQLLETYRQHGISVLGLIRTPEEQIGHFGTVAGSWIEDNCLLKITKIHEKPTVDYARNNLKVQKLPDGAYLTVLGQYVLSPQLFGYLEGQISNNLREQGEFQITSVLDQMRQDEGMLGLVMEGERFDIGLPGSYADTIINFRRK